MATTSDWHQLFDRYYRKCPLYEMLWTQVPLQVCKIAGAPFGGPIAVVRDARAAAAMGGAAHLDTGDSGGSKPKIRIFTAAGMLLASMPWEHAPVVGMSWTAKEQLVVLGEDGSCVLYSVHGERLSSFHALPDSARADGVAQADFWPEGLVVRTGLKSELWAVRNFDAPRPQRLADAGLSSPPTSLVALPAAGGSLEVLLATASGSIVVVDERQAQDQLLSAGPFAAMAVSPSGSLLAAFADDGSLHLMSTDFSQALSKFATGARTPPQSMLWCGEEAVLLAWPNMLLLVGLLGDYIKFPMDAPYRVIGECDGARIVTATKAEWVARVPEATESIFKAGSQSAAAKLFDAAEAFEAGSARADDNLRELALMGPEGGSGSALKSAIDQCLHAAAHEFEFDMQRSLLKAASYGKLVCPQFKSDKFTDMCRTLRVLNAVRAPHVGLPLTYTQYSKLEAEVLVDRLVNRHEHLLALRICDYLRMHPERVLTHWACTKIKHCEELSDEQLGDIIVKKLNLCPGISYSTIASTAFRHGRKSLATLLLEYEPLASDQVPLLMSMQQDELALTKAIASGDSDLVYLALLHLKKHRKQKDFFALIKDKPMARDLYIAYCKQTDLTALKHFYYTLQQPQFAADIAVLEAYQCVELKDRLIGLELARDAYEREKKDSFSARAVEEELLLLKLEREAEVASGESGLVDLSVSGLMERAIARGDSRQASKLKTAMRVSDKRMWHSEVNALARAHCWDELAKLVANKKVPPIGFQPFIEACLQQRNVHEAARYIARLPDYHEQMEWLCNIGLWNEAVDIAGREKDAEALLLLRERCRQPMVVQKIEKLLQIIGTQGK